MSLANDSVLWALMAYALAIATSGLLLRYFPALQRLLSHPGQSRYASVDGLRGYLAFGVFVHHMAIIWVFLHTGVFDVPKSKFYAQIGLASVALFFMITGFLFWGRL
ncbi:acyltransferase, partial [Pseudomonas fragi]|nr:acyltransferase [Pseudomonas sp. GC01]